MKDRLFVSKGVVQSDPSFASDLAVEALREKPSRRVNLEVRCRYDECK